MLTQMQVFNKYMMPVIIETFPQEIAKVNAASGGAIVLTAEGFEGDFYQESFYKALHSAQRRNDRYAANAAVTPTDLIQDKASHVKVAGGFGPVLFEPSQMTWLLTPTAEGIEVISRNFVEALVADQFNTAVMIAVAALANNLDAYNDYTGNISYTALNSGHAKFGDASGGIVADVVNGNAFHTMIGNNLANAERLYQSAGVQIVDILGKRIVVTDSPSLVNGVKGYALSLVSGAVVVSDGGDLVTNIETSNGNERIETTMQADYSFGAGIKGYSWDEAAGGKSPLDADLATGTNWPVVMSSVKHTAGVVTRFDI